MTAASADAAANGGPGLDILCLGEPMIEFNQQPDGRFLQGFGGDVSNVAVAAARQGARAGIATRIGADGFGDDLTALWAREGVDVGAVARDPDAPTGLYFVRHGPAGHSFEYRRAGSAASRMTPETLPVAAIRSSRLLHLSGVSHAISASAAAACDAAMDAARRAGALVSYDPNLRLNLWPLDRARETIHRAIGAADIALPGLDDARRLTGLDAPEDIVAFYLDLGASVVALTLGADGVLVADADGAIRVSSPVVSAVDATGAGDCFDGAFLARRLAGDPLDAAAAYAVVAASLSVQGYGAVAPIPAAAEVREALTAAAPPTTRVALSRRTT